MAADWIDGTTVTFLNVKAIRRKLGISSGSFTFNAPLAEAAGVVSIPQANAVTDGYLSAADFVLFASKENALTFSAPLSRVGDVVSWAGDTDDVPEGALNLYYTAARFNAAFAAKSTTDLTEGTNLYYTAARFSAAFASKTTDDLAEGAVNKYFTDTRARAAFSATAPLSLSAGGVISADFTVAWTWTANGIGATPTDRLVLSNSTAAALGAQQYSPALRFFGSGWSTGSSNSQTTEFRIYTQPVQGSGAPSANLLIDWSINGAAFVNRFTFTSPGNFTAAGAIAGTSISGSSFVQAGAATSIGFAGRSRFQSASDGVMLVCNNGVTDFTRLQFGGVSSSFPALARSSAELQCVLADASASASFKALQLKTENPTSGTAQPWKLGSVSAGAIVVDTANFVEISVNGTAVKLVKAV